MSADEMRPLATLSRPAWKRRATRLGGPALAHGHGQGRQCSTGATIMTRTDIQGPLATTLRTLPPLAPPAEVADSGLIRVGAAVGRPAGK